MKFRHQFYAFFIAMMLSLLSAHAFADSDIYPEAFVEDCKASYVNADPSVRLLEFRGVAIDYEGEGKKYRGRCECLSQQFFSKGFEGEAEAYYYGAVMSMIEYKGRVNGLKPQSYNGIQRMIRRCETVDKNAERAKYEKAFPDLYRNLNE